MKKTPDIVAANPTESPSEQKCPESGPIPITWRH
jgi:hypothetical protein